MGRLSRYSKAFSSGVKDVFAPYDKEGPGITVSPFAPGEATTGAGILRAITAVAGARRERANWEAGNRDRTASRYRDALEVKSLEAKIAGTDPASVIARDNATSLGEYRRTLGQAALDRAHRPTGGGTGRMNAAGAKLALAQLDEEREKFVDEQMRTPRVGKGGARTSPIVDAGQLMLGQLKSPVASERLAAARALGVSPMMEAANEAENGSFKALPVLENGLPAFDAKEVSSAYAAWLETRKAGIRQQWEAQNAPRRSAYRAAVMQGLVGDVDVPEEDDPLLEAARAFAEDE